jgi:isopentenyldiphosphate isomerase
MKSGHMAIPWTARIHKLEDNHNNVFMTQRVPRKEWSTPEVKEAMYKEWTNLQENGTYEEVRWEPWMTVIPTMWVINRSTDDHGKEAGKLKA